MQWRDVLPHVLDMQKHVPPTGNAFLTGHDEKRCAFLAAGRELRIWQDKKRCIAADRFGRKRHRRDLARISKLAAQKLGRRAVPRNPMEPEPGGVQRVYDDVATGLWPVNTATSLSDVAAATWLQPDD